MAGFRFTLSHDVLGDQVISEPDGWKGAKIILERHPEFMSLVEYYEGSANGGFIFYGNDGTNNGGIDFIKEVEQTYGFDARIDITVEYSPDDLTYQTLFEGQLDLSSKNEMKDNRMQVPVIRDDFWAKFINRMDTPVDLSTLTDLDGNAVDAASPIECYLSPQRLRQTFQAEYTNDASTDGTRQYQIAAGEYGIIDFENPIIDEVSERFTYINIDDPAVPFEMFAMKYAGSYRFQISISTSTTPLSVLGSQVPDIVVRFQINEDAPITLTKTNLGIDTVNGSSRFTYDATHELSVNDQVRIYFENPGGSLRTFYVNGSSFSTITVTGDTVYDATISEGYLIHDLFHGVLARLGLGTNPFYSEYLGGEQTTARQYEENGCFWNMGIFKGLQIRQYSLSEKPFFISFRQLWDGMNPIANLGLGYEDIDGQQVIRIEEKAHFFDVTRSLDIDNVREISSTYDQDLIFKTIKTGFKKWQSENASGIDDPQTKHTYATRFVKTGKEINLESDFIAASLAVETTRRTVKEKTADYKFDNDNFIIALRTENTSPSLFYPEVNENFTSITGLLNSSTRYNSILTPLRNLLRWGNYLVGCLQSYTISTLKFVSGEGNYDMVSDYDCAGGNECQAVLCGSLAENGDITVSSFSSYLFVPMEYSISHSFSWDNFLDVSADRKKAIGISQLTTGHAPFFIKKLEYDLINGEKILTAWPKSYFNIDRIDQEFEMSGCSTEITSGGSGADVETCYRITEDELIRITEDGSFRVPEDCDA